MTEQQGAAGMRQPLALLDNNNGFNRGSMVRLRFCLMPWTMRCRFPSVHYGFYGLVYTQSQ